MIIIIGADIYITSLWNQQFTSASYSWCLLSISNLCPEYPCLSQYSRLPNDQHYVLPSCSLCLMSQPQSFLGAPKVPRLHPRMDAYIESVSPIRLFNKTLANWMTVASNLIRKGTMVSSILDFRTCSCKNGLSNIDLNTFHELSARSASTYLDVAYT